MFDRKKYKKFAKIQLKKRWNVPILMTAIVSAIIIILQAHTIFTMPMEAFTFSVNANNFFFATENTAYPLFQTFLDWLAIPIGFTLLFAEITVYLKMSRGPEPIQFSSFLEGLSNWGRATLAGLWQLLWVFLWSLLFIIPGIVKAYAYSQMFYLLAEFPSLSISKSLRVSKIITNGHKGDLFIMDVSFLGWAILASLPACLGWLWLAPYISMTRTNAYHAILKEALEAGKINPEDLKE